MSEKKTVRQELEETLQMAQLALTECAGRIADLEKEIEALKERRGIEAGKRALAQAMLEHMPDEVLEAAGTKG